jgi:hypothetical protein
MLEKYQELNNSAKVVLSAMEDGKPKKWSELKKITCLSEGGNASLKTGIDQLIKLNILLKKDRLYQLHNQYHWQIGLIARKQSDKINLDSYHLNEIIREDTSKSKITFYGLRSDTFYKNLEEKGSPHLFDLDKQETFEFKKGIKVKEAFGEYFGVPLGVKIKAEREKSNEKEIIEKSAEYHMWNYKLEEENLSENVKRKIKSMVMGIISNNRNTHINFKEAGENIVQKILKIKKEYRFKELKNTFRELLKKEGNKKIKRILKEFQEEFISILNYCDISKDWLERIIFYHYGQGAGLFSTIGISQEANQEAKEEYNKKWKRNIQFKKAIDKLNNKEKERTISFLMNLVEKNKDLYPTHVTLICRASSSDIMPSLEPKPPKYAKSS